MIFIRADANNRIGIGHVKRCLSIAGALKNLGEKILFITADHQADMLLTGFDSFCLDTDWANMESELPRLLPLISAYSPSLLLADSYYVTAEYFTSLRPVITTACMDDLNQSCWDTDILINYNVYAPVLDYSRYQGTGTKLLLGPQYTPLRREFQSCPPPRIKKRVTDVFVSTGGADPENVAERIMKDICPEYPETGFHFVIGPLRPGLDALRAIQGENVILHINEQRMSELMGSCDLAVSASGTTLYELCAMGIPTVTYTLADNQLRAARQFELQNTMINAGDCRHNEKFTDQLKSSLNRLIDNAGEREILSARMRTLVDGKGAERIAAFIHSQHPAG